MGNRMRDLDPAWQRNLEIIGAPLFLRYRKRLLVPGIMLEIRRAHPGLSWVDILVRVHAGRQIIHDRHAFDALEAIRTGQWQQDGRQPRGRDPRRAPVGRGGLSARLLVFSRGLFVGFLSLYLAAALFGGSPLIAGALTTGLLGLNAWRRQHAGIDS